MCEYFFYTFLTLFDDSTFAKITPKEVGMLLLFRDNLSNAKILKIRQSCSMSSLYRFQLLLPFCCFKNFSVSNPIDVVFLETTDPASLRAKEIPNITGREQEM